MKDKLFSIYVLFLFMFAPITGSYLFMTGRTAEQGQTQSMAIMLSVIGWYFFATEYIFGKRNLPSQIKKTFVYLFIFGSIYLITRLIYLSEGSLTLKLPVATFSGVTSLSMSFFLRWASLGVVSFVTGILLIQNDRLSIVSSYIPYFTIPLTMIVSAATYMGTSTYSSADDLYGFNYQNITYYHAAFMLYNAYYVFFYNAESRFSGVKKIASGLCMVLNIVYALSAGGRGGFVLLGVVASYVIIKKGFSRGSSQIKSILLLLISICAFALIADQMEVWNSAGFYRVTHMMEIDSGARDELREYALSAMEESNYMGAGLGAVWYTIGYPSHNIIQDLIVELGVIGLLIFASLIFKTYKKLIKYSKTDSKVQLIIMNSFNLIMLLFSSYWISDQILWLTWGCVVGMYCYFQVDYES